MKVLEFLNTVHIQLMVDNNVKKHHHRLRDYVSLKWLTKCYFDNDITKMFSSISLSMEVTFPNLNKILCKDFLWNYKEQHSYVYTLQVFNRAVSTILELLTKIVAAQNNATFVYNRVRGLYLLGNYFCGEYNVPRFRK